jgi:hypothetical protein
VSGPSAGRIRDSHDGASERRVYRWPAILLTVVFVVVGSWMFVTADRRMGFTPGAETRRTGTAAVESCAPSALYLWAVWHCAGQVRWAGAEAAEPVRVTAVHELRGTADVVERRVPRRFGGGWETVAGDYPSKDDEALFFVMLVFFLSFGVVGWFAGIRLAQLLPEPPAKPAGPRTG